jgi:hypothetical protein
MSGDSLKSTFSRISADTRFSSEEIDRRLDLRHQFTTEATVTEETSRARMSTRTADIGRGGCFVDTLVPLPVASNVRVILFRGKETLEAPGTVVYSQSGLGMGIAFGDLSPEQTAMLERWLSALSAPHDQPADTHSAKPKHEEPHPSDDSVAVRLIYLLVGKGLLTESDAASLLRERGHGGRSSHDPLF